MYTRRESELIQQFLQRCGHMPGTGAELYESLGNEVRLEPVAPELLVAEECAARILVARDRYRIIYTRPDAGI